MMVVLLILFYAVTFTRDGGEMIKAKYRRGMFCFSTLMLLSFVLLFLYFTGVRFPNPIDSLQNLYDLLGLHY